MAMRIMVPRTAKLRQAFPSTTWPFQSSKLNNRPRSSGRLNFRSNSDGPRLSNNCPALPCRVRSRAAKLPPLAPELRRHPLSGWRRRFLQQGTATGNYDLDDRAWMSIGYSQFSTKLFRTLAHPADADPDAVRP